MNTGNNNRGSGLNDALDELCCAMVTPLAVVESLDLDNKNKS